MHGGTSGHLSLDVLGRTAGRIVYRLAALFVKRPVHKQLLVGQGRRALRRLVRCRATRSDRHDHPEYRTTPSREYLKLRHDSFLVVLVCLFAALVVSGGNRRRQGVAADANGQPPV